MTPPRPFHVINGYSAAGTFGQALLEKSAQMLVHDDVLSCGPLPSFESAQQWSQLRGAFWNRVAPGGEMPGEFDRDWVKTMLSLNDSDSVVVWSGTNAAEQLMLAFAAHLLSVVRSKAKLHVIQFTPGDGTDWAASALGMMNGERMVNHPPIEPVSDAARAELERYWVAITSPDPTHILAVIAARQRNRAEWH